MTAELYISKDGIYSRKDAVVGSAAVKKYKINEKVSVVAKTNTDYYKLKDGTFIHKDYLSTKETEVKPTTTTPQVTTLSSAEKLLNNAPLNPIKTSDVDVDTMVDEIFGKILTDDMSTYQKTVAIYNYIINTYTYGRFQSGYSSDPNYHMAYDSLIAASAYGLMKEKRGVCDDYASLFMVMTRRIGLESYIVSGQVASKNGGTTGHTWNLIKLDGQYYTFDAQVEQSNTKNGQITYYFFCRTESSVDYLYTYGYSDIMEMCAVYSAETVQDTGNPRDYCMALFGNFVVDEGEKTYNIGVVGTIQFQ